MQVEAGRSEYTPGMACQVSTLIRSLTCAKPIFVGRYVGEQQVHVLQRASLVHRQPSLDLYLLYSLLQRSLPNMLVLCRDKGWQRASLFRRF